MIAILLLLDCIIMTSWHIVDPLKQDTETFSHEKPKDTEKDILIEPHLKHCSCKHINIWLGKYSLQQVGVKKACFQNEALLVRL